MNAEELVQELRNLNNPNLRIYIPCPHCCGQPGADFELLDAELQTNWLVMNRPSTIKEPLSPSQ